MINETAAMICACHKYCTGGINIKKWNSPAAQTFIGDKNLRGVSAGGGTEPEQRPLVKLQVMITGNYCELSIYKRARR